MILDPSSLLTRWWDRFWTSWCVDGAQCKRQAERPNGTWNQTNVKISALWTKIKTYCVVKRKQLFLHWLTFMFEKTWKSSTVVILLHSIIYTIAQRESRPGWSRGDLPLGPHSDVKWTDLGIQNHIFLDSQAVRYTITYPCTWTARLCAILFRPRPTNVSL